MVPGGLGVLEPVESVVCFSVLEAVIPEPRIGRLFGLGFVSMAVGRRRAAFGALLALVAGPLHAAPLATGALYASNGGGKLYEVDPASGAGTLVGFGSWVGSGLTFAPIPEPSAGWMLALGLIAIAMQRRA